jgi:uncharacterized membrane protein
MNTNEIKKVSHSRHHIYVPTDLGAKAADVITAFVGSWLFVGIHAIWFVVWIVSRIEAFPYGLLTLLVSLEAIFLSTFVMMSQNRAAARDHIRDDHEAEEVDMLFQINQTQLEILRLLRQEVCPDNGAKDQGARGDTRIKVPNPLQAPRPAVGSKLASAGGAPPNSPRRRRH